ncbi:MAG: hypothetical protein HGJ94_22290 [Desulfosarcina sp.]|nr:hypothetical protein [Desulfosarcina sp.]
MTGHIGGYLLGVTHNTAIGQDYRNPGGRLPGGIFAKLIYSRLVQR